jgi:hypothetical protein
MALGSLKYRMYWTKRMARAFLRKLKISKHPNHMRPADGGAFILPSKSSVQSLLPATIFPSSEAMLLTSTGLRFLCTPIAQRCIGQRQPNHRVPVTTMRSASDADNNQTALDAPPNARFALSITLPMFIQQRNYKGRRGTSHSCQHATWAVICT